MGRGTTETIYLRLKPQWSRYLTGTITGFSVSSATIRPPRRGEGVIVKLELTVPNEAFLPLLAAGEVVADMDHVAVKVGEPDG